MAAKTKSSLYLRYCADACNKWWGPSPWLSAWTTRSIAAVVSHWRHCVLFDGQFHLTKISANFIGCTTCVFQWRWFDGPGNQNEWEYFQIILNTTVIEGDCQVSLRSSSQQPPVIRVKCDSALNRTRHVGSVTCARYRYVMSPTDSNPKLQETKNLTFYVFCIFHIMCKCKCQIVMKSVLKMTTVAAVI